MDDKVLDLSERLRQQDQQQDMAAMEAQFKQQKFMEVANFASSLYISVVKDVLASNVINGIISMEPEEFEDIAKQSFQAMDSFLKIMDEEGVKRLGA